MSHDQNRERFGREKADADYVLNSVLENTLPDCDTQTIIAAAFRAAAELPYEVPPSVFGDAYWPYRSGVEAQRNRGLSIADELES